MKDIYSNASSVLVWLGDGPQLGSALMCDENAELEIFECILKMRGMSRSSKVWTIREIVDNFIKNFPENVEYPNTSMFAPGVNLRDSSFLDALVQNREKILRLQMQDLAQEEQEESTIKLETLTGEFLLWIHYSHIAEFTQMKDDYSAEDRQAFSAYLERIMKPRSDV